MLLSVIQMVRMVKRKVPKYELEEMMVQSMVKMKEH